MSCPADAVTLINHGATPPVYLLQFSASIYLLSIKLDRQELKGTITLRCLLPE